MLLAVFVVQINDLENLQVFFLSMMRQYLRTRTAFNMNAHYAHIEGVRGGGEGGGNDDDDNDDHDLR